MRTLTGYDRGALVFASIILVLAVSSYSVTGVLYNKSYYAYLLFNYHYGVASWALLNAILGIVAGVSGSRGAYVAVIVLTILGTLAMIGGVIVVMAVVFLDWVNDTSRLYTDFNFDASYRESKLILTDAADNLGIGLVIIDSLSFVFLIVLSCIACCNTCCGRRDLSVPAPASTIVYQQHGMVVQPGPPGYVGAPPSQGYSAYPPNQVYGYDQGPVAGTPYNPAYPAALPGHNPQGYASATDVKIGTGVEMR